MATLTVRASGLAFSPPNYQAVSAADKFAAVPGGKYLLHYKNGATPQAAASANTLTDQTAVAPPNSAPAVGWADVATSGATGMAATTEATVVIPNASRFIDAQGFVNIKHPVTFTTVTVDIYGPL